MNPTNPGWPGAQNSENSVPSGAPSRGSISSRVNTTPGAAPIGNGSERPVTFWSILDAFRRRWVPAVAVAIPAALLVAGLLWQMIPAQFETAALLKIDQFQLSLTGEDDSRAEFIHYRNSQINYITSRTNLTSAMRVDGIKETRMMKDMKYPVEFLEKELSVDSDFSEEYIRISLAGEYPEDIAAVVNAVKDVYLNDHVYHERKEQLDYLQSMEKEFSELDRDVTQNNERIDRLASELGTGDSEAAVAKQQLETAKIQRLQRDLEKIEGDIRLMDSQIDYLVGRGVTRAEARRRVAGRIPVSTTSDDTGVTDDGSKQARAQLSALRSKIARFERAVRNKNHPDLVRLKRQEKELARQVAGIGGDLPEAPTGTNIVLDKYSLAQNQKDTLQKDIRAAEDNYDLLGQRLVELEREKNRISHLVKAREDLAKQITSKKIDLARPQRVRVVQEANVPEKRNIKKRVQLASVGGLGTLFMVLAGFTMFEWFSHRVGSTSDIANAVNLRLIGTIPSPDKGGLLGMGILAGKVDYDEWNRAVIESMDVVRTYLMRHIDPSRPASILITSASANEGKTTVSCQLAASLARSGKRIAIVDCDFRRPSAHLMMDGREGPGICEYLRGEVSLPDICQETQASGLTFIPAGQVDQEVLQKLTVDGGRAMIDTLKSQFDFVIIDTSPLLFVAEPSMLAQNADIVLLSTRKDYSRIPYVAQSRDSLRSLQVPLLGAVMVGSDSDFQRSSYGYRQEVQRQVKRETVNS
ncbi:MAG: AAA family ATPase [Planctomycetaceae bacterium]|nr:AAA family ATPase [Planctomycetaceae bacterium]